MIDVALEFIRDQLNDYLVANIPMGLGNRVVISNVVQQEEGAGDGLSDLEDDSILFSLIHIEEDRIYKDQRKRVVNAAGVTEVREPELKLNIYVIFSAHFNNYLTGIKNLSGVISFFQSKNVFDAADYPSMDPSLGRLVTDLYTFSLDQNFQFWQSLGGKFLPSIMYKIRMLTYQENLVQGFAASTTESSGGLGNTN